MDFDGFLSFGRLSRDLGTKLAGGKVASDDGLNPDRADLVVNEEGVAVNWGLLVDFLTLEFF